MPSKLRRRFLEIVSFSKESKYKKANEYNHKIPSSAVIVQPQALPLSGGLQDVEIYGYVKGGSGPNKTECQDSSSILYNIANHTHYFAVYDGHGPNGKHVSTFVANNINNSLTKNALQMEKALQIGSPSTFFNTMFKSVENKLHRSSIDVSNSGSCCISVLISNQRCYVANVGDSRAILCRQTENGTISVIDLSSDHKPTRLDEQTRILQSGGFVEPVIHNGAPLGPLRVWNQARDTGLAMTRAMGDAKGKQAGLIAEPELTQLDLTPHDKFIIIASDGLWDVMSSKEAVSYVLNYLAAGRAKSEAAKALTLEARNRWTQLDVYQESQYCDDITVIIAFMKYYPLDTAPSTLVDLDGQGLSYV